MSSAETDEERTRRLDAQAEISRDLAKSLPDTEDVLTDLEWASMGIELMEWNHVVAVPREDSILAVAVNPLGWSRNAEAEARVEVPEVLSISWENDRVIAQFRRYQEWPTVTRVLLVVDVGDDYSVHEVPILFANALSIYVDLGTNTDLRDRLQRARDSLVRSLDAAVSFEFILSADDGDSPAHR